MKSRYVFVYALSHFYVRAQHHKWIHLTIDREASPFCFSAHLFFVMVFGLKDIVLSYWQIYGEGIKIECEHRMCHISWSHTLNLCVFISDGFFFFACFSLFGIVVAYSEISNFTEQSILCYVSWQWGKIYVLCPLGPVKYRFEINVNMMYFQIGQEIHYLLWCAVLSLN